MSEDLKLTVGFLIPCMIGMALGCSIGYSIRCDVSEPEQTIVYIPCSSEKLDSIEVERMNLLLKQQQQYTSMVKQGDLPRLIQLEH